MITKKQIEHIVEHNLGITGYKVVYIGHPVEVVANQFVYRKNIDLLVEKLNVKIRSEVMEALEEYNRFLIDNQYVDIDVETEEPTAIQEFMAIKTEKV